MQNQAAKTFTRRLKLSFLDYERSLEFFFGKWRNATHMNGFSKVGIQLSAAQISFEKVHHVIRTTNDSTGDLQSLVTHYFSQFADQASYPLYFLKSLLNSWTEAVVFYLIHRH